MVVIVTVMVMIVTVMVMIVTVMVMIVTVMARGEYRPCSGGQIPPGSCPMCPRDPHPHEQSVRGA
jgi:hypothetical protein